jgi:hypothetical protein
MTSPAPCDRFLQAYRNLGLFPLLEAQEIESFRVKYGQLSPPLRWWKCRTSTMGISGVADFEYELEAV